MGEPEFERNGLEKSVFDSHGLGERKLWWCKTETNQKQATRLFWDKGKFDGRSIARGAGPASWESRGAELASWESTEAGPASWESLGKTGLIPRDRETQK